MNVIMTDLTPVGYTDPSYRPSEEVKKLRLLLGEVGQQYNNVIQREVGYVVPEKNGSYSVYVRRKGVHQVIGVFRSTDINKQNNLFVGTGSHTAPEGSFNRATGVITLAPSFHYNDLEKVMIDYVHQEGLTDEALDSMFLWACNFLRLETGNFSLDFSYGSAVWWSAIHIARLCALLILSTSGVIQAGYNLRIEDFALETKAWGEGMIAQFLWKQYEKEVNEILCALGCKSRMAKASRISNFGANNMTTGSIRL